MISSFLLLIEFVIHLVQRQTLGWAGRVTVPAPFSLTNSMTMGNVHRKKMYTSD